jgi:hypothetical protein
MTYPTRRRFVGGLAAGIAGLAVWPTLGFQPRAAAAEPIQNLTIDQAASYYIPELWSTQTMDAVQANMALRVALRNRILRED